MKKILPVLLFVLIFLSCENTDIVEVKINFNGKIVVYGELYADEYFSEINISRSFPVGNRIDDTEIGIEDAKVIMVIDEIRVIPLHHSEHGNYKPLHLLRINEGSSYELYIETKEKKVYAKTYVPIIGEIDNISISDNDYLQAEINANPNDVYGATWVLMNDDGENLIDQSKDFYSISKPDKLQKILNVRTDLLPSDYFNQLSSNNLYMQIYSFDRAFHYYFNSRNNNEPIKDVFSQGSGAIAWNVIGNDAIGLFIGISKSKLIKVN